MNEMDVERFVRHFKHMLDEQEGSFAFFLGAGCSISSGVPGARDLVQQWLPKLHYEMTGGDVPYDRWLQGLSTYNADDPAASYGWAMRELFPRAPARQREIERIVYGKDPGFGYAAFAKLVTRQPHGPRCNFVLTTNFDDMVADALYLYTQQKPLVIVHESLVSFVETGRSRPLVIKLHGDAMLAPRNTAEETHRLDDRVSKVLTDQLAKRGLIFIGYGGNDQSVTSFLKELPDDAPSWGIYWVNTRIPDNDFGRWLTSRPNAVWVNHLSFDELMLLTRAEFGLEHPALEQRFKTLTTTYQEAFAKLSKEVEEQPESAAKGALSSAVEKATEEFKDWWAVELAARRYKDSDPQRSEAIYQQGIGGFPDSAELLGCYAVFLHGCPGRADDAENAYVRALTAHPKYAVGLGNYAVFLQNVRQDLDKAETFYQRALDADPKHANNLSNYARCLRNVRQDMDKAETFYQRAIDADPKYAPALFSYAVFLQNIRQDLDKAETFYQRAIDADPKYATALVGYAVFLQNIRQDPDKAETFYQRAIDADPKYANALGNLAGLLLARGETARGLDLIRRALALAEHQKNNDLLVECPYYRYANGPPAERASALAAIRPLIESGVRSPGWSLAANIARAEIDKHPNVPLLKALAAVISDGAEAATLDQFEEWRLLAVGS